MSRASGLCLGMALQKSGVSPTRLLRVSDLFPSVSIGKSIDWRSLQIRCLDLLLDVPKL